MSDPRIDFEKLRYIAVKERILADDSEIDERTLADTVEGLTNLHELLAATLRAALADEVMAGAIKQLMVNWTVRMTRFEARAEKRRQSVKDAMVDCDIKELRQPDFTATLRDAPPKVVVIDEAKIPQTFWEPRPHLRKRELLEALKDGLQVEGAMLSNPGMSLSVRVK